MRHRQKVLLNIFIGRWPSTVTSSDHLLTIQCTLFDSRTKRTPESEASRARHPGESSWRLGPRLQNIELGNLWRGIKRLTHDQILWRYPRSSPDWWALIGQRESETHKMILTPRHWRGDLVTLIINDLFGISIIQISREDDAKDHLKYRESCAHISACKPHYLIHSRNVCLVVCLLFFIYLLLLAFENTHIRRRQIRWY